MKIRKIRKSDFKEYVKLRENEAKNYSKVIGKKIEWPPKNIIRKEMKKAIQDRKNYILVMIDKDSLIAYLHGVIEGYSNNLCGYVNYIFVIDKFRKKGVARKLINEFLNILKKKKIKKIRLRVNLKNKPAIRFYKKLGFETSHYEMESRVK